MFVGTIEKIPRAMNAPRSGTCRTFIPDPSSAVVVSVGATWALETDVELLVVRPSEASLSHYERHGFADRGEPLVWLHTSDPA